MSTNDLARRTRDAIEEMLEHQREALKAAAELSPHMEFELLRLSASVALASLCSCAAAVIAAFSLLDDRLRRLEADRAVSKAVDIARDSSY